MSSDEDAPADSLRTGGPADEPDDGLSMRRTGALDLHQEGRLEEAEQAYRDLLAERPGDVDTLNNLGSVLTQMDRPEEGLQAFDHALQVRPLDERMHANRGHALTSLDRLTEALAAYDEAIGLNPDFAEAHLNRARTLQRLDRTDEAIAALDRALTLSPDHVESLYLRALLLGRQSHFEAGLAAVDRALSHVPDNVEALHLRANLLRAQKRYDEALATFRQALALQPGSLPILGDMGVALREMGALGEAILCFSGVLGAVPESPVARRQMRLTVDAHVAALKHRRAAQGQAQTIADGRLILGIGSGRCGSTSLVKLLRHQDPEIAVTHEEPPGLPWHTDLDAFAFHRDRFKTLLSVYRFVGDVAHWWLPYLDRVVEAFPDCRIVALKRDRQGTVDSFERLRGFGPDTLNHWCDHDGSYWRRSLWDAYYPTYDTDDRTSAIGRYWDAYYEAVDRWATARPDLIRVVSMESLNDPGAMAALLRFLGFPAPVMPARLAWNVGVSHEGASLHDLPPIR